METGKRSGMVVLAGVFAISAIGIALFTNYFQNNQKNAGLATIPSEVQNWATFSDTVPTSSGRASLSKTASLSNDLYANYVALSKGTFTVSERDKMLADLVKQHVTSPAIVPNISLTDLNIEDSTSLETYGKLLTVILAQSGRVKEYELNVFSRMVSKIKDSDITELKADADLYKRIAASLLVMEVPSALAPKHLEAVKSVGALAKATENLAAWSGDPLEALVALDSFNKADGYVQNSINNLVTAVTTLQKKS